MVEENVDPPIWFLEFEGGEGDEVVVTCASEEGDSGGGIRFVGLEV